MTELFIEGSLQQFSYATCLMGKMKKIGVNHGIIFKVKMDNLFNVMVNVYVTLTITVK